MTSSIVVTQRAAKVEFLRQVADLLEQHPELPIPEVRDGGRLTWFAQAVESGNAIMRAFPSEWVANDPTENEFNARYLVLSTTWVGHLVEIVGIRESVSA